MVRLWPMLLKKPVLHQPQNSREFFAPGPRSPLAMLQPLRRSWVDFHMTTTTPSYKEYKKSIRTQIKTRPPQEPTLSTALTQSSRLFPQTIVSPQKATVADSSRFFSTQYPYTHNTYCIDQGRDSYHCSEPDRLSGSELPEQPPDYECFAPGIILSLREIGSLDSGVTVGLESLLGV